MRHLWSCTTSGTMKAKAMRFLNHARGCAVKMPECFVELCLPTALMRPAVNSRPRHLEQSTTEPGLDQQDLHIGCLHMLPVR